MWLTRCGQAFHQACVCQQQCMQVTWCVTTQACVYVSSVSPTLHAGDVVAQRRRMPSAKAYDFFLETSYVEVRTCVHHTCTAVLVLRMRPVP